jgi:hypothetical protein
MEKEIVIPAQVRAGRALLDWSQERLAQEARVSVTTVRDFEGMRRGAEVPGAVAMRHALENAGVVFVPAHNDGGPGVRLIGRWPNIVRRPIRMNSYDFMPFAVEWQGREMNVHVPRVVLDDFWGGRCENNTEYVVAFNRHLNEILRSAVVVIDTGSDRITPDGKLYLRPSDFDGYKRAVQRVESEGGWVEPESGVTSWPDAKTAASMPLTQRLITDANLIDEDADMRLEEMRPRRPNT